MQRDQLSNLEHLKCVDRCKLNMQLGGGNVVFKT